MGAGVPAPRLGRLALPLHVQTGQLIARLRLQHPVGVRGFGHEVRHVLLLGGTQSVEDLELVLQRLEPPLRVAIENHRQLAFVVGLEARGAVKAVPEAPVEDLLNLGLVFGLDAEVDHWLIRRGREGACLRASRSAVASRSTLSAGARRVSSSAQEAAW